MLAAQDVEVLLQHRIGMMGIHGRPPFAVGKEMDDPNSEWGRDYAAREIVCLCLGLYFGGCGNRRVRVSLVLEL